MSGSPTKFSAPRGTRDLLPPESWAWQRTVRTALDLFAASGYAPIETPAFEHTELFARGVGETTEVVTKQMYTFDDQGGRSLTLRPEATASTVRAVLEHNLHRGALPVKLSYAGWMYRQERPQKGRYRQFFQLGIEALGSDLPTIDAEVIEIAMRFFGAIGLDTTLRLNSIGHLDPRCRLAYHDTLQNFLRQRSVDLADVDRARIELNPLRSFDSKEPATMAVMSAAPTIADHLCEACKEHHEAVRSLLQRVGVTFDDDPTLVRGLDYYGRTAFEFIAGGLGSQNAVGGGGRYDGLAELLGGPPVPGIGFALGLDRILLAQEAGGSEGDAEDGVDVYVVAAGDGTRAEAFALATRLRAAGISCDLDHLERSLKGQMKDADRAGARYAVLVGASELEQGTATVRDLSAGEQESVPLDGLEEWLRR